MSVIEQEIYQPCYNPVYGESRVGSNLAIFSGSSYSCALKEGEPRNPYDSPYNPTNTGDPLGIFERRPMDRPSYDISDIVLFNKALRN